jgi:decaprenylphospho-beta-D-erythro-pentofuranosid-2-ulose 2-reductase
MSDSGGQVIVGATSDVAKLLAREIAEQGSHLVIAGRDSKELTLLAGDLQIRTGARVTAIPLDVTNFDAHAAFVEQCIVTLGSVRGLVLCQGYLGNHEQAMNEWSEARQLVEVNYSSAVSLANRFAQHMTSRGQGYICGVSSVAGDRGRQSNYLYGSTKAGFTAYLEGLRSRLFRSGVDVITVKPGLIDTSMTWGRINPRSWLVAAPEQVARDIARAIRKRRNVVYTPWYWRYIMCVVRLIPEPIFKRLRF